MKILITGGAGFIGSRLSARLLQAGHQVRVLDSLSAQVHTKRPEESPLYRSLGDAVDIRRGDVTSRGDLEAALEGQEVVVHLAAETGGQSMYEIDRYTRVNIGGTALLLDVLANSQCRVRRVVVASSRAVYGEGKYRSEETGFVYPAQRSANDMTAGDFEIKHPGCSRPLVAVATDEDSRLHPVSVYGITKLAQEQLIMTVCPSLGISAVALRYQNVYGPGQSLSNPYTGMISIFSNLIMSGKGINVFEDGRESRDFVYIDDVVEATLLATESSEAAGQVLNVGSGIPVSVLGVAQTLSRHFGANVPVTVSGNFRVGDIRHNHASLERIGRVLRWAPRHSFEQGIALFCAWVREAGAAASDFDASLAELRDKGMLK